MMNIDIMTIATLMKQFDFNEVVIESVLECSSIEELIRCDDYVSKKANIIITLIKEGLLTDKLFLKIREVLDDEDWDSIKYIEGIKKGKNGIFLTFCSAYERFSEMEYLDCHTLKLYDSNDFIEFLLNL